MSRSFRALPQAPRILEGPVTLPLPSEAPKPLPAPPRRGFLGAAAALVAAPAVAMAVQAPEPDAALIAKCGEVIEAHEACVASYCYPMDATPAEAKPYEARADYFSSLSFEAAEVAAQIPATTTAGLLAKARAALALAEKNRDDEIIVHDNAEWLAVSCLEEVVAVLGAMKGGAA